MLRLSVVSVRTGLRSAAGTTAPIHSKPTVQTRTRSVTKSARCHFSSSSPSASVIGSKLPERGLDFSYTNVKGHIEYRWRDGAWDSGTLVDSPFISIHINSNVLHYGQALFEGLKAYHGRDGKVRVLNAVANAARMQHGCERLCIPHLPTELFKEGIDRVVSYNKEYIPTYGNKETLYLRPNLFGHGEQIGLSPAPEYTFIVSAHPVGNYFKDGPVPADAKVIHEFDRAATNGMGAVKAAGNYAADMYPSMLNKKDGYTMGLYLDASKQYIEEFGTSNFVALSKDGAYVTPDSTSVLRSITNIMMEQLAQSKGIPTERRKISVKELPELRATGGCGTAVVYQPIQSIKYKDELYNYENEEHATIANLAAHVTQIGFGEAQDLFGWTHEVQME